VNNKSYSLKSQVGHILLGRIIGFCCRFATPIILVRIFTKDQYGGYAQILMISSILIPIFRFGIPNSLFYFFPRQKTQNNLNKLMSQTYFSEVFLGLLMVIILIVFEHQIIDLLHITSASAYIYYVILFLFLTLISFLLENIFIIEEKPKIALFYFIFDPLLRAILLISAVITFKTVKAAVLALILFWLIKSFVLFVYLRINYKISPLIISMNKLKEQLKYVYPMGISILVSTIGKHADKLILALLLTTVEFAVYSVGLFSIPLIQLLYISVGNVVLTKISEFSLNKDNDNALSIWKKMILKNATVTIPVICFFLVIAKQVIIFLFTAEYISSVPVFRIILLSLLVQMLGYGYILRGFGKTKKIFKANLIKMFFSIIIGLFLIKHFGIIGAALTSTMALAISGIIQLIYSKRTLSIRLADLLPWFDFAKLTSISLIPLTLVFFVQQLNLNNSMFIILSGLVYFPCIVILLIRCNYFSLQDITSLKQFIKL